MRTPIERKRKLGFTLGETLVTVAILGTLMGLASQTVVQLYRNFGAVDAYRAIHQNARTALGTLSKDLRSGVSIVSFATNDLTFAIIDSAGVTNNVRYYVVNGLLNRVQTPISGSSQTRVLTDNVVAVKFEMWNHPGLPSTQNADTFEIRAVLGITNATYFRVSTDTLQTRVLMRNKTY